MRIFAGGYSWSETREHGIAVIDAEPETGTLTLSGTFTSIVNPFSLAVSPSGETLYAASNTPEGRVHALRIRADGTLEPLNDRSTEGAAAVHVAAHGDRLYAANHDSGELVVLPVEADGSLGPVSHLVRHLGSGPDPANQQGPHPHMAVPDPTGGRLLVPDKGNDHVYVYELREGVPVPLSQVHLGAGVGPRHLVFHPDGRRVYVACELESVVVACGYDPGTGALWRIGAVSTLPLGTEGWNAPSAVALSPDGRFGYVLNRGHESVAVLRVHDDGLVRQDVLRLGDTFTTMPWHLLPDPSGTRMFVANQLAGTVLTLAVDPESGLLSPLGAPLKVTDAAFLAFAPR